MFLQMFFVSSGILQKNSIWVLSIHGCPLKGFIVFCVGGSKGSTIGIITVLFEVGSYRTAVGQL